MFGTTLCERYWLKWHIVKNVRYVPVDGANWLKCLAGCREFDITESDITASAITESDITDSDMTR